MYRRKAGISVFLLCGCIFAPVGTLFLVISIFMALNMDYVIAHGEGDVWILPFIFGLLGAPRMQARGAALATTISRVVELGLCLMMTTGSSYIRPVFGRFLKQPRELKSDFARQCLPLLGGCLCWGIGFTS